MEWKKTETIDWHNLGFNYLKCDFSYISYYQNGQWDQGFLTESDKILISASSTCIHYGQQAFEGLKAYRKKDGSIHVFRPFENAKRMNQSCRRLLMPEVPEEKFLEAIKMVVQANSHFVPPYESKATLYIRPYIIGVGDNLGLRASSDYLFGVFVSPVGRYYKGEIKPVKYIVSEYDRAAPRGTGGVKVGGNYASSLYPCKLAKEEGYMDCIYLDPETHTKIEEVGAANFFAITPDYTLVTPKSPSILPSITKKSILEIAREMLKMNVEEREIYINELDMFCEAGACGTALGITPIGGIFYQDKLHIFHSETEVGPITKKLYEILNAIQFGDIASPNGWMLDI